MLLEDDETQTPARKTLKRCSRTSWLQNLLKYYPRPPCAPSLIKSRFFRILQFTYLLTSVHFWNSLYVYTWGILGCLLGFGLWTKTLRGQLSIVIDFCQSIKLDDFFLWVRLWSIIDINRYQSYPSAIDIDWYRVYRLISDIDFYRLTTPGEHRIQTF